MASWVGIREARGLPGLRLALLRGFPSPWSQAARAIFELKRIPFVAVHRAVDDAPDALLEWTGQDGLPAAVLDAERPRTGWAEILLLAERLQAAPALIPAEPLERALMFGLSNEILGEMGLVWCRRLIGLAPHLQARPDDPEVVDYRHKYGSSGAQAELAPQRVADVLALLARQIRSQRDAHSEFLIGDTLSAVDLYWAVTSNLFAPLPALPLADSVRESIESEAAPMRGELDAILLVHRDAIYERYLDVPVEI